MNDTDDWEEERDRVTLMTLHASKGLEFPVVYLVAVEEGLLPHERSRQHPDQTEEERRLMFVGITRAQQRLQISLARHRDFRGQRKTAIPSSFLMDLPRSEMEMVGIESRRPEGADIEDIPHAEADLVHAAPMEDEPVIQWPRRSPEDGPKDSLPLPSRERAGVRGNRARKSLAGLTTAAELANGPTPSPPDPDAFQHGMLVLHPQHGLGRIVALSGSGQERRATVDFTSSAGRRKFLLVESPLLPVRKE